MRRPLALIALGALVVRVLHAVLTRDWQPLRGDALTYHLEGGYLAAGEGFRRAFEDVPTAEFPPAQIVVLAAADLAGLDSVLAQKLAMCMLGAATVALVGVLGRQVGGSARIGLVAAAMAAVYPPLVVTSGTLMAETVYGLLLAGTLVAAAHAARTGTPRAFAVAGALLGLTALARGEALALLALLLLPLAWRARSGRAALATAAACLAVLAPWTARNLTTFAEPVALSNNVGGLVRGANCEATYFTDQIGAWRFDCYGRRPAGDESEQAAEYRRRGTAYLLEHADRLPLVMAARLGRLYDVWRPWSQGVFFAAAEGRHPRVTKLGLLAFWALLPLAGAGALLLRRRGRSLLVVLAPVALVTVVAVLTYGSTRFRFAAEPSFVILGAVAVTALAERWRPGPARVRPGARAPA